MATTGILALVGGDEFRAHCEPMDHALLAMAARQPARVVIVPTAAAQQGPHQAAQNGVRYFTALGAQTTAAMILSPQDANNPALANALADADLIYLTGGDPAYLLRCLRDSRCWQAMQARYAAGAMLAGSSAGAMALGAAMRYGRSGGAGWTLALALAPRIAVLPHHDGPPRTDSPALAASLAASLHRTDVALVGIAVATACVSDDGGERWQVLGVGAVTLYTAQGATVYHTGDCFILEQSRRV
ncbi:MAG: Type 1 glutamine amidotransferase-like domain-containing protein [Ktedonobacterales bacterium]